MTALPSKAELSAVYSIPFNVDVNKDCRHRASGSTQLCAAVLFSTHTKCIMGFHLRIAPLCANAKLEISAEQKK
jgi:hypothetical protein